MYKLLIVDDEARIRNGLSTLIEWEVYGIELAGLAEDGVKAWLRIRSSHPDIVLVDISMPNMGGLELIELCSHLEAPPKFIILSGYNDFEYVQKAIQLGAVNYLLKPVDQNELIHAVSSCVQQLDKTHAHQQQVQESMLVLRNDLLRRVLHNQIDTHEFREKARMFHVSLHCLSMRVGVITLPIGKEKSVSPISEAIKLCEDICSSLCPSYVITDIHTNIGIIFKDSSQTIREEQYSGTLSACSDAIAKNLSCASYYALGREVSRSGDLCDSYTDCISKMEKKLLLGDEVEAEISKTASPFSLNYQAFVNYVEVSDREKIAEALHQCFRRFLQDNRQEDIRFLKYQMIDLVSYVLRAIYLNAYFTPELERKKLRAFSIIGDTDSIRKLEDSLIVFFSSLTEDYGLSEESGYPPLIQRVLAIIRTDYSDSSLSLKTIAGQLDVNPAYLGREFSLATGEYFNDFLNRHRIAKATQLLTATSQKTAGIAEAVGFNNSSYFFTVFKKITGQSPKDYRATHS
ncbi:MAG: response regulator [Lachnospiraceae bacterium]|nr:response regulator [Lachnospiraceae bacterium]